MLSDEEGARAPAAGLPVTKLDVCDLEKIDLISAGDSDGLRRLLKTSDSLSEKVLCVACSHCQPECVKVLIDHGVATHDAWRGGTWDGFHPLKLSMKQYADVSKSAEQRKRAHACCLLILEKQRAELSPKAFSARHALDLWLLAGGQSERSSSDILLVKLLLDAKVDPNAEAKPSGCQVVGSSGLEDLSFGCPLEACALLYSHEVPLCMQSEQRAHACCCLAPHTDDV
jgi:hypothetical protein